MRRPSSAAPALAVGAAAIAAPAMADEPAAQLVGVPDGPAFDAVRAAVGRAQGAAETAAQARRRARRAKTRIDAALRAEGFYGARSVAEYLGGEPPRGVVRVDAGPRFLIGEVRLELAGEAGGDAAVLAAAREALGLASGDPARAADILAAEARTVEALADAGFPDVAPAAREAVADHARAVMDLVFRFEPGRPAVFGPVENAGPARLRGRYLGGAAPFETGEPYARAKLERFEDLLRDTGAFAGVDVRLAPGTPGTGPEERTVIVEARTGKRRTIAVGGSYSTTEGPGVEVEWTRRNIFSGAETLTASAKASQLERVVDLEVAAPHFRRPQRTLRLGAAVAGEETDAFDRIAFDARVGLEQPFGRRTALSAGLASSISEVIEAGGTQEDFISVSAPTAITWEGVDAPLDPQSGVRAAATAAPTLAMSSAREEYAGLTATVSGYRPVLSEVLVAAARVKIGAVVGAELGAVPADDRLYAGGGGSVRGYEFQGVGPRDADNAPSGGRSLAETSAELRWRVRPTIGVTAFVDGGTAGEGLDPPLDEMRWGAGVGLRYYATFGPLRADIAAPLDRRTGDPAIQFYLGVGQTF
ncbi:MAG: BamA/TamA family outer membrane protein [Caulobacterales bacterium]|nr:BamA/TamA family outer membrane protein [Caulobacterales bacterium]